MLSKFMRMTCHVCMAVAMREYVAYALYAP